MRDIEQRAADGRRAPARLAIDVFAHRLRKYIGAYAAVMGGVDAIVFTGGIGENSALIRHRCTQRLEFLGAALDEDRNRDVKVTAARPIAEISEARSRARLLVVRADEELTIVREAAALLVASKDRRPALAFQSPYPRGTRICRRRRSTSSSAAATGRAEAGVCRSPASSPP